MWIVLTFLLLAASIALLVRWRRDLRLAAEEREALQADLVSLREDHASALAQISAHQFAIFNSMVEGILILDDRGRVQTINNSLERLFNISGDVRGKTIMEAFRLHDLLEIADRAHKEGIVEAYDLTLQGIRHTRHVEVNAAAIQSPDNNTAGLILICHDFTRIKELENIRKDFVANVSHELRTPLTLIKGFVETLIDGAKDDPAVATRFLQTIHKHANRLAFLIEDLLTLSLLESGQIVLQRQPTSLRPVVERVFDQLQAAAAQKSITLRNNIASELTIQADAERLEQVLHNLIENAIKYGRSGGSIELAAVSLKNEVQVSVKDDGPGIPEEAKDRIFERFFRVDRARSRDAGGTGLGLAIVKHIVQSHGGRVWVDSVLEQGSTFHFTLPLEPQLPGAALKPSRLGATPDAIAEVKPD